ncbi:MAG TPA: hypothetical protein VGK48_20115 [Terriglobia bacterium]|jgi:hypothetical protein
MSTNAPDNDAASREEIADTWRWKQDAASWQANLAFPGGDAAAVNRWVAATVDGLLADFAPLARVRTATLLAGDGPIRLTRTADERAEQFRARLLDAIRTHPLPVTSVELGLDIRVWVRTTDSPDRPELAWLSYPGIELRLQLLPTESRAWVDFSIENTLFSAFTYPDEDPNPLYPLNQPLLEAALRRLRARATDPLDRSGELKGACEFGFSPDRDDY